MMKKLIIVAIAAIFMLTACEEGLTYKSHNTGYYPYLNFDFHHNGETVLVTIVDEVENPVIPDTVRGHKTRFDGVVVPGLKGEEKESMIHDTIKSLTIGLEVIHAYSLPTINRDKIISITFSDSVRALAHSVFLAYPNLDTVNLGNGLEGMSGWGFMHCKNLKNVIIGDNLKNIGLGAFAHCESLTSIVIPDNVEIIDLGAFGSCTSLTDVTIGNGVKTIGLAAFEECSSLKEIIIPNSVETIGKLAFQGCTSLESISLPAGTYNLVEILGKDLGEWRVNGVKIQDLTNFVATDRKLITKIQ